MIISIPGIAQGRQLFGLMFSGMIFEDRLIKNLLKYKVKPIGIKTTTPVIKQFLKTSANDFF